VGVKYEESYEWARGGFQLLGPVDQRDPGPTGPDEVLCCQKVEHKTENEFKPLSLFVLSVDRGRCW
jgi:hypothetical protein